LVCLMLLVQSRTNALSGPATAKVAPNVAPLRERQNSEKRQERVSKTSKAYTGWNVELSPVLQESARLSETDVWAANFRPSVEYMVELVDAGYTYIAFDAEFPGCVTSDGHGELARFSYDNVRKSVNSSSPIQYGFSVYDAYGRRGATFTFNLKWDRRLEIFNANSIDLLENAGLSMGRHAVDGIDQRIFSNAMSQLFSRTDISWICFHGAFDFGYLVKGFIGNLPNCRSEFLAELHDLFPNRVDLKTVSTYRGGLERLASELGVGRTGTNHEAGSDSRLTGDVFFSLLQCNGPQLYHEAVQTGHVFGLEK